MRSKATNTGELSSVQRPSILSSGVRCSGLNIAALGHALPVGVERCACARGSTLGPAVREHCGVHGARRRAGDGLDLQPRLLEQPVEHAPGEGAMRAAALQGEVDQQRVLTGILGQHAQECHSEGQEEAIRSGRPRVLAELATSLYFVASSFPSIETLIRKPDWPAFRPLRGTTRWVGWLHLSLEVLRRNPSRSGQPAAQ